MRVLSLCLALLVCACGGPPPFIALLGTTSSGGTKVQCPDGAVVDLAVTRVLECAGVVCGDCPSAEKAAFDASCLKPFLACPGGCETSVERACVAAYPNSFGNGVLYVRR